MLKRNVSVKTAPQRWQDNAPDGTFDVVLTFEEKVFDMVLEGQYFFFFAAVCSCSFEICSQIYLKRVFNGGVGDVFVSARY